MKYILILKILYCSLLIPLHLLSSEKVYLIAYPKLVTVLNNNEHSMVHISVINRYLQIPMVQETQLTFSNNQSSDITLGLYLFFKAKEPTSEQSQYIVESNQAFNQAFKPINPFNIDVNISTNDLCNTLENALWWNNCLKKIPFMEFFLNFIYQARKINISNKF